MGTSLLRHTRLAAAQLVDVKFEVTIPVESIHGQVEMSVDQDH